MATKRVTNQQLAFARAQVDAAARATSSLARGAHCQAALWQLGTALRSYADELKSLAQVQVPLRPGRGMFARLNEDFARAGRGSAALDELARMEREVDSWLYRQQRWEEGILDLASDNAISPVRSETTLNHAEGSGAIALVDLEAPENRPAFNQDVLAETLHSAMQFIQRQRQDSAEY